MVYSQSLEGIVISRGVKRLLFISQVRIALRQTGRDVDKQSILKWVHQGRLKAKKIPKGETGERFEWLIDPADLKELMKKMRLKRLPGGSWFKD